MGKVLIIEDNEDLLFALEKTIEKEGYAVRTAKTGENASRILDEEIIDIIFLDIGLPDINGIDLIPIFKLKDPDTDIIMLTGRDDVASAVSSIKAGAMDYITKPFEIEEIKIILKRTMQTKLALRRLRSIEDKEQHLENIISTSKLMKRLKGDIKKVADAPSSVLITGETGVGKELVASAIHELSRRARGAFIKVDCGAIPEHVFETEFFGHERGAFTDAREMKKGLIEISDGGTLFLDEVGNLPYNLQPKFLRVLEESTFRRIGGIKDIKADLRVIAATNKSLENDVRERKFRDDLFYRLSVICLDVPPLRERREDIPVLATFFLQKFSGEIKKPVRGITKEAMELMTAYHWPGNIRELKNTIERAIIFLSDEWITPSLIHLDRSGTTAECNELLPLQEYEKKYIEKVLNSVKGNRSAAARLLNITRTTLRAKLNN